MTCMRRGHSSSQGGRVVRSLLVAETVFESIAGMFLRIRSEICPQFEVHIRYHLKFATKHDEGTHPGVFNSVPII